MKELLYFSFSDLLVKVEYSKEANSLKYSSHREVSFNERVIIEQYLLTTIAVKTDFYNRYPALFIYLGKDEKLIRDLNLFHLKNTLKFLANREKEVKEKVDELISHSMSNYYFERIGDTILELRKNLKSDQENSDKQHRIKVVKETIEKMNELIKAYNNYSDKKITIEKVVPRDLIEYI
ncbi:MAG: hypothetical protein ONB31_06110 [candidate division KSB1 bacterium]|nr:hypothetical protein [candidate division KSB1 bacterium]MDZ7335189.1 hypothetical protein [candidate division KSB1 bacterium]MDZ7356524.1 hypothetical protein [candidate division KSB1 bacterium]MDZ7400731.1 hypothetical protein [candidate division KSB1 bacterium]